EEGDARAVRTSLPIAGHSITTNSTQIPIRSSIVVTTSLLRRLPLTMQIERQRSLTRRELAWAGKARRRSTRLAGHPKRRRFYGGSGKQRPQLPVNGGHASCSRKMVPKVASFAGTPYERLSSSG